MTTRSKYLLLCALGLVLPYSFLVPWLLASPNVNDFFSSMLANRISTFFAADVLVSALVLLVFMHAENKKVSMKNAWAPILALLTVGVSLALPLFLYLREAAATEEEAHRVTDAGGR